MSDEIVIDGGIGGTYARTEDLAHAAGLLAGARDRLESVAAWARAARADVADDPILTDGLELSAVHVDEALAWVNQGPGGADGVASELGEISRSLAETVRLLEGAERGASSIWESVLDGGKDLFRIGKNAFELNMWLGTAVAQPGSFFVGGPSAVNPLANPELTTVFDAGVIEGTLGLADDIPIVAWLPDVSVADFLLWTLMLATMDLSLILGNLGHVDVEPESTQITQPPADTEHILARVEDLYPSEGEDSSAAPDSDRTPGASGWDVRVDYRDPRYAVVHSEG